MSTVVLSLLPLLLFLPSPLQSEQCPTQDMSVYALFSITKDVDIEGFSQLLKSYKDATPYGKMDYSLYFGDKLMSKQEDDLVSTIGGWLDSPQLRDQLYTSSIIPSTVAEHSDDVIRQDCSSKCVQQTVQSLLDQTLQIEMEERRLRRNNLCSSLITFIKMSLIYSMNALWTTSTFSLFTTSTTIIFNIISIGHPSRQRVIQLTYGISSLAPSISHFLQQYQIHPFPQWEYGLSVLSLLPSSLLFSNHSQLDHFVHLDLIN